MTKVVRSAYGALLQTRMLLNKPYVAMTHSTLNEKLNVFPDVLPAETDVIGLKYFCIGNKGLRYTSNADGTPKLENVPHLPKHSGLYNEVPFVLRLPSNDLDAVTRLKYRLRKLVTINSVTYVAYYLKALDVSATVPRLELRVVQDQNNITSTPFEYSATDLFPEQPNITNNTVLTTGDTYLAASAKVTVTLEQFDIDELLNVSTIMYGDTGSLSISEIGLVAGSDKSVTGDFNGVQRGYIDAIGTVITNFIPTLFPPSVANGNFGLALDVGSIEPLLVLSSGV